MESSIKTEEAKVIEGMPISASQVRRLKRERAVLQDKLDSLQIKKLTKHPLESDQAKVKADNTLIQKYQDDIKLKDQQILIISLYL